jgi:ribosome recycling factor
MKNELNNRPSQDGLITKIDIHPGELNTERIKRYSRLAEEYNVEKSTVRDIFHVGADWVNSLQPNGVAEETLKSVREDIEKVYDRLAPKLESEERYCISEYVLPIIDKAIAELSTPPPFTK